MLRQLAHLTRPVEDIPGALAVAVYADAAGATIAAADRGYEGVACVDDAARALGVLSDLWTETRAPVLRAWAGGLLEFVLSMQDGEGRFVNFVHDWSGARNEGGPTSLAGGSFWQARGTRGLARAWLSLGDDRAGLGAARGMAEVRREPVAAGIRAIHILTAVELLRAGRMPELRTSLASWCEELVACRRDGVLFDDPDESEPHLWAHVQEAALAEAGAYLGRDDLIGVARESALRYLAPLIDGGFDLPTVQPDGVASALLGVERLAAVTGEPRFWQLAERSRAWFYGRNPARRAVYDRAAGRVGDGIDAGVVSDSSGAESNIAGAQALFGELVTSGAAHWTAELHALPTALVDGESRRLVLRR
ncbi:MAG: hypothetical protein ACRDGT_05740 [Candidatus Limnocylindria bacterium]